MEQATFSQKLKRLEEIVSQLETADLELEKGLALLEEGVKLHKECQHILTESQAKITTLFKVDQKDNQSDLAQESLVQTQVDDQESTDTQEGLPF